MAIQGLAPATLKTYLSGIRHAQIMNGFPEPAQVATMPRLKLLQAGVVRERAFGSSTHTAPKPRLPITIQLLSDIVRIWSRDSSSQPHDTAMLRAAATLCFFGFFRSWEITVPSAREFDPRLHLTWGDISINDLDSPTVVKVHLKRSKIDQAGKGVAIFVGATGSELCPVAETVHYVRIRGPSPGPFLRFHDGSPLTKAALVKRVREALTKLGLDASCYAGQSFRIGAATTAACSGIEDSAIRSLGRWRSDAFLRYIRPSGEYLAEYSRHMAASRSFCASSK